MLVQLCIFFLSVSFQGDLVVEDQKSRKLAKADRCLQKFRYHDALDAVLGECGANPPYVISVIVELSRRNALEIALADRDAESLKELLYFLVR